jgi:DNA-directed RNA polymerase subunit RPC12/RpoP
MSKDPTHLLICRRADDVRRPNSIMGYQCSICNRDVQVSPDGLPKIATGAVILCNPCGFEVWRMLEERNSVEGVTLLPNAQEELENMIAAGANDPTKTYH